MHLVDGGRCAVGSFCLGNSKKGYDIVVGKVADLRQLTCCEIDSIESGFLIAIHAIPIERVGSLVDLTTLVVETVISLLQLFARGAYQNFFGGGGVDLIEVAVLGNTIENVVAGNTHGYIAMAQAANGGAGDVLVVGYTQLVVRTIAIEEAAIDRAVGSDGCLTSDEGVVLDSFFDLLLPGVGIIMVEVDHIGAPEVLVHDEVEVVLNPCARTRGTEEFILELLLDGDGSFGAEGVYTILGSLGTPSGIIEHIPPKSHGLCVFGS